nr:uncharacterized protein LOC123758809 isoform X2 [Procambarus clarkii]
MSEAVPNREPKGISSTMSEHLRNVSISSLSTPHQIRISSSEPDISSNTCVPEEVFESKSDGNSSSWETWISTSSMESNYYSTTSSEERYYSPSSQKESPKITSDDSSTTDPFTSLKNKQHLNKFTDTSCSSVCNVNNPNISDSRITAMPYESNIPTRLSESVTDKKPSEPRICDTPLTRKKKKYGFLTDPEIEFKAKPKKGYNPFLNTYKSVPLPSQLESEIHSLEQLIYNIELQLPPLKSLLKRLKQAKLWSNLLNLQEYCEPSLQDFLRMKSDISKSYDVTKLSDLDLLFLSDDISKVGKNDKNITEKLQDKDLSAAKNEKSCQVLFEQLQSSESLKPGECSPLGQLLISDEWEFDYPHLCLTPEGKQCSASCPDKIDPSQYICHGSEKPRTENVEHEEWSDTRRRKRISFNNCISHSVSSMKKNGKDFLPLITNEKQCSKCLTNFCFCVKVGDTSEEGSSCIPGLPVKPTAKASGKHLLKDANKDDFYMMKH